MRLFLASLMLAAATISASAMGMSFDWGPTAKCFDPRSPPITLSGVPRGTKTLQFNMVDLDAPDFRHGGGKVAYSGRESLPYGAFRYKGPCPPEPHSYRITVKALDSSGKVLAAAQAQKRFP
jgi:phosphatidylethanolamine-binding protein (PEBP) family uncharacterized protein